MTNSKTLMGLFLGLCVLALALPQNAVAQTERVLISTDQNYQNLVGNASFESWTGGIPDAWAVSKADADDPTLAQDASERLGDLALQVTGTGTGAVNEGVQLTATVEPNTTYTLSLYYKSSLAGHTAAVDVDGNVTANLVSETGLDSTTWKRLAKTFTTATDTSVTIKLLVETAAEVVSFDGISLTQGKGIPGFGPHFLTDTGDQTIYGNLTVNDISATNLSVDGTISNTFTLDKDDTGGDISLIFGTTNNERLTWNATTSEFDLTDDLNIANSLDVTGATGIDGDFDVATSMFTVASATGNTSVAGTLGVGNTLTVSSGGASITGGINNNSGGITSAGAVAGVTTLAASGDVDLTATGGSTSDPDFYVSGYGKFLNTSTLEAVGNVSLGAAAKTVEITSSGWGVDTNGNMTGIGSLDMDGDLTASASLVDVDKAYTNSTPGDATNTYDDHAITRSLTADVGVGSTWTVSGAIVTIDAQNTQTSGILADNSTLLKLATGANVGANGLFINAVDSTDTWKFYVDKDGNGYFAGDISATGNLIAAGTDLVGTTSRTFTLNTDDEAGDMSLIFGTTNDERLTWNTTSSEFDLTDDLNIANSLDVTGATGIDGDFDVATSMFTVASATGNTSVAGTLGVGSTLTVSANGASITGGIDNNSGGITEAGAVSGVTTLAASGDVDLTATGGNASDADLSVSGYALFGGTLDANGQVDLGDGGDTVTITSSDWTIGATGDMSGIGSIGMDGNLTASASQVDVDKGYTNVAITSGLADHTITRTLEITDAGTYTASGPVVTIDAVNTPGTGTLTDNSTLLKLTTGANVGTAGKFLDLQNSAATSILNIDKDGKLVFTTDTNLYRDAAGDKLVTDDSLEVGTSLYVTSTTDLTGELTVGGGYGDADGGVTVTTTGDVKLDGDLYQATGRVYYSDTTLYRGDYKVGETLQVGVGTTGAETDYLLISADGYLSDNDDPVTIDDSLTLTANGTSLSATSAAASFASVASTGNINSTTGVIQTNSTNRIDNAGNLANIGTISSTYLATGASYVNITGSAVLQMGATTVMDTSRNLSNIADLTMSGTLDANGVVALGDNGDTVAIDSSDWDVTATGDMSGIGSIGMDGNLTASASQVDVDKAYTNSTPGDATNTYTDHTITRSLTADVGIGSTWTVSGAIVTIDASDTQTSGTLVDDSTLLKLATGANVGSAGKFIHAVDSAAADKFYVDKDGNAWFNGDVTAVGNLIATGTDLIGTTSDTFEINTDGIGAILSTTGLTTADKTFTFPDETGKLVTEAGTQTLTNKTIDDANNTLTILEGSITDGTILARLASNESISGNWSHNAGTTLTINGTLTANGAVTLGNGDADAIAISSTGWSVDSTGVMTGIGSLAMDGDLTVSTDKLTVTATSGKLVTASTVTELESVAFIPEFDNVSVQGDGSDNFGSLSVKYDSTSGHNYYVWTTNEPSTQDYDVIVRFRLPDGFDSFDSTAPIKLFNKVSSTPGATKVQVWLYDSGGNAVDLNGAAPPVTLANTAWTESTITIGTPTVAFSAGQWLTLKMKVSADQAKEANVGELTLKGNW